MLTLPASDPVKNPSTCALSQPSAPSGWVVRKPRSDEERLKEMSVLQLARTWAGLPHIADEEVRKSLESVERVFNQRLITLLQALPSNEKERNELYLAILWKISKTNSLNWLSDLFRKKGDEPALSIYGFVAERYKKNESELEAFPGLQGARNHFFHFYARFKQLTGVENGDFLDNNTIARFAVFSHSVFNSPTTEIHFRHKAYGLPCTALFKPDLGLIFWNQKSIGEIGKDGIGGFKRVSASLMQSKEFNEKATRIVQAVNRRDLILKSKKIAGLTPEERLEEIKTLKAQLLADAKEVEREGKLIQELHECPNLIRVEAIHWHEKESTIIPGLMEPRCSLFISPRLQYSLDYFIGSSKVLSQCEKQQEPLWTIEMQWCAAKELSRALAWLHERKYIHGDLKSSNVLWEENSVEGHPGQFTLQTVFCDFGFAFKQGRDTPASIFSSGHYGSISNTAYEVFTKSKDLSYEAAECHALGATLYELYIHKRIPWAHLLHDHWEKNIMPDTWRTIDVNERTHVARKLKAALQKEVERPLKKLLAQPILTPEEQYLSIILRLMRLNPKDRLTAQEAFTLLDTPFPSLALSASSPAEMQI